MFNIFKKSAFTSIQNKEYSTTHKVSLILISALIFFILKEFAYVNILAKGIYYPINLFVTSLHEMGHGLFAILTGGSVSSITVNSDGSGVAYTSGGIQSLILMGGYLGSALLGNILLYIALKKHTWSK